MQEWHRAYTTTLEVVEVASVVDVVAVTQKSVKVVADAERLHNKFRAGLEASPHSSMARQWHLYLQQEHA